MPPIRTGENPEILSQIHVNGIRLQPTKVFNTFWRWCAERKAMDDKRRAGSPYPWSTDSHLTNGYFCNTYRVLDRGCQFLISEVIQKGSQKPRELLFRILLYDSFTKIETYQLLQSSLGDPKDRHHQPTWSAYTRKAYESVLRRAFKRNTPLYTGAFIKPTGVTGPTHGKENFVFHLENLEEFMSDDTFLNLLQTADYIEDVFDYINSCRGMGGFTAYQLLLNLSYSSLLSRFSGMDFVSPGLGCISGLQKLFTKGSLNRAKALDSGIYISIIRWMADTQDVHFQRLGLDSTFSPLGTSRFPLELADIEHSICEVDKYARLVHPEIRQRRKTIKRTYKHVPGRSLPPIVIPNAWKDPRRTVVRIRPDATRRRGNAMATAVPRAVSIKKNKTDLDSDEDDDIETLSSPPSPKSTNTYEDLDSDSDIEILSPPPSARPPPSKPKTRRHSIRHQNRNRNRNKRESSFLSLTSLDDMITVVASAPASPAWTSKGSRSRKSSSVDTLAEEEVEEVLDDDGDGDVQMVMKDLDQDEDQDGDQDEQDEDEEPEEPSSSDLDANEVLAGIVQVSDVSDVELEEEVEMEMKERLGVDCEIVEIIKHRLSQRSTEPRANQGATRRRKQARKRTRTKPRCVNCRERKTKCTKGRPTCRLCKSEGAECIYDRNSGNNRGSGGDCDESDVLFLVVLEETSSSRRNNDNTQKWITEQTLLSTASGLEAFQAYTERQWIIERIADVRTVVFDLGEGASGGGDDIGIHNGGRDFKHGGGNSKQGREFLVIWEGYGEEDATWEPEEGLLEDAPDALRKFWATKGRRNQRIGC
ncbi:hypothetical protein L218DRAFT_958273 [Marasmius fiardii PR-910]|nr:hypothetical protein L218DRAFT_958273 [Marasmius fiardii PR-910]